jgi:NAD(P)-dependent dehydrogenase (short-subunit alcohol dehydrogenase family)
MRLTDKVAIVSGAASGMGTATARMFAREGVTVVIADVLEHEGRQVAEAGEVDEVAYAILFQVRNFTWTAELLPYRPATRRRSATVTRALAEKDRFA